MAQPSPQPIGADRDPPPEPASRTAGADPGPEPPPALRLGVWIMGAVAFAMVGAGLIAASGAPEEQTQGEAARLLFVHVPSVITAYVALGVGLLGALVYLIRPSTNADLVSASAIELGVLFTGLTLFTGMIWGRLVWSVWWDWSDARMVTTAVLFFLYVGYLALRRSIDDARVRAGRCAVLGVIAFVQVPIVHYSVLWFRTLHQGPTLIRPDVANATLDAAFGFPLGLSIAGFVALFAFLLIVRLDLARTEMMVADLSRRAIPVGSAVGPPRLGNRE